ncbi:hypothetical protein ACFX13_031835 [Malus domestica]
MLLAVYSTNPNTCSRKKDQSDGRNKLFLTTNDTEKPGKNRFFKPKHFSFSSKGTYGQHLFDGGHKLPT